MLTNAELLAKLGEWVSPGDLSFLLRKILRVPEIWDRLHDPDFLHPYMDSQAETRLLPAALAKRISAELQSAYEPILGEATEMLSSVHIEAIEGLLLKPDRSIEDVSQLSHHLQQSLALIESSQLAELILQHRLAWRSPLACAWPDLINGAELISELLRKDCENGLPLALNALLANMPAREAALSLLQVAREIPLPTLLLHIEFCEPEMFACFSEDDDPSQFAEEISAPLDSLDLNLAQSIVSRISGDLQSASEQLQKAGALATLLMASVEDQSAEVALRKGDIDLEMQARMRANLLQSSPERRAQLALLHARKGEAQEALELLASEAQQLPELVAAGEILQQTGDQARASELMHQAIDLLPNAALSSLHWLDQCISYFCQSGQLELALNISQMKIAQRPASEQDLIGHAELIHQAGDPLTASEYAFLGFALSPESRKAHQVLAYSLQQAGKPKEALAHWIALSHKELAVLPDAIQCAIDAGFGDLAVSLAETYLKQEPHVEKAHVLLGKALISNGELDSAEEKLLAATREFPSSSEAWITLAACQEAQGEGELAGETLLTAIQLIPNDPELLDAHSRWLQQRGRTNEALQAAEKSYLLAPQHFERRVHYGEMLSELGHSAQARLVLEPAVEAKPFHPAGLSALAGVYEDLGKIELAAGLMEKLPRPAPAEAHLAAAKIFIHAAQSDENARFLKDADMHLSIVAAMGHSDPSIRYWQGLLSEKRGEYENALQHYQHYCNEHKGARSNAVLNALLGIGRSSLATSQAMLAIDSLEEALPQFPYTVPLMNLLAQAYLESEMDQKAISTIERALEIDPSNSDSLRQMAHIAVTADAWVEAERAFKHAISMNPGHPEAWVSFAESALMAGKLQETREALSHALSLGKHDIHTLNRSAQLMCKMGKLQSALRLLRRALRLNPNELSLLRAFAHLAEEAKDYPAAKQAWEQALGLNADHAEALIHSANLSWRDGQRTIAMDGWRRAHELDPSNLHIRLAIAKAYLAEGKPDSALEMVYRALKEDPHNPTLSIEAARIAMHANTPELAFEILQNRLRRAPQMTEALITLAECLLHLRQPDQALEALDSVLNEQDLPPKWYSLRSIALARKGRLEEAGAAFEQGYQQDQVGLQDALLLSQAAIVLARWSEAVNILQQRADDGLNGDRILAEIYAYLRAKEVLPLYVQCHADKHAPPQAFFGKESDQLVRSLLEEATHLLVPKHTLEQIKCRARLAYETPSKKLIAEGVDLAGQDPSGELLEASALAQLRAGDPYRALTILALRDDFNVDGPLSDLLSGICQLHLKQPALAQQSFSKANQQATIQPLLRYLKARIYLSENKFQEAITQMNAALAAWPDEPAWHHQLGKIYAELGDQDSALPHFQQAFDLKPEDDDYALEYARILQSSGSLSQALALFQKIVRSNPSDGMIWLQAAELALVNGNAKLADEYFQKACAMLPSEPGCLVGRARCALKLDNPKGALSQIQTALRLIPDDPDALIVAGEILAHQGKFDKALASYEHALKKSADPLPINIARSKLLIRSGRAMEALDDLRELARKHTENEHLWAAYAQAAEAAGHLQEGLEAANQTIRIAPNSLQYQLLFGRLFRKAGQLDRALEIHTHLELKNPAHSEVLFELGQTYESRRQYAEALDAYQRAIACDHDFGPAYYHAGLLLRQLKAYSEAGELLNRAHEFDPHNPEILHQLAAVRALEFIHGGISQEVISS